MALGGGRVTLAAVHLWGSRIGAVRWDAARDVAAFEYDPAFLPSGVEVAPLTMPLGKGVFAFPALGRETFRGLPGLLADSLPDRYGDAILRAWMAAQGRAAGSLDPVERLCYVGRRGMGALEFEPALADPTDRSEALDVAALVDLAGAVLARREDFAQRLERGDFSAENVRHILRVGTSAGGARAKAVIAWNPTTGEVRSGQVDAPDGFEHWLLKFDGVSSNGDRGLDDGRGYGRIEYAYHLMARAAGIEMSDCRLLEEGGRSHFMTRRFDRVEGAGKLHVQTLCALDHLDYNLPHAHSYEQAFAVARRLGLPAEDRAQLLLRMVFNVVARNQDDHTKNLACTMDRRGRWRLAPAYDVTYAYVPGHFWLGQHQLSVAGQRAGIGRADLAQVARHAHLQRGALDQCLEAVKAAVASWPTFAAEALVPEERAVAIGSTHSPF